MTNDPQTDDAAPAAPPVHRVTLLVADELYQLLTQGWVPCEGVRFDFPQPDGTRPLLLTSDPATAGKAAPQPQPQPPAAPGRPAWEQPAGGEQGLAPGQRPAAGQVEADDVAAGDGDWGPSEPPRQRTPGGEDTGMEGIAVTPEELRRRGIQPQTPPPAKPG